MKKTENFKKSLEVLKRADYGQANEDEIYRMGVIGQFHLTFELAWKALQELLRLYSVEGAETGSPRDVLKKAYASGFISDSERWLLMLKKRNLSTHIYNVEEVDELLLLIRDSFTPALDGLVTTLEKKEKEAEKGFVE